ncbi:hypothetical protein [Candidatus Thiodictyon syntrophicum]|uniref:CopG family transcriptional regulator n=1 Tax=Candidatus Thiodictyon syntrophicum TaxID=1166950 RepID=A0A2K8U4M3_9GAMM|nr:hypothetical protein [Candidatus Thiodictyon syntrophicum]AUB80485.1 hypothetical protein THSYN_05675 [Candidatus Thiodictyon syntrophicum]
MKNITLSVDEETYQRARIAAAERNTTVSALVGDCLRTFAHPGEGEPNPAAALFAALDRAQGFSAGERMTREETHER